ncbi:speckle-type POZ protein-like [Oppia nitens]|uniref:speckle-type POZ protein-like n=1 Tax=Oppia nitens TaxID=1686743 RepID=UPI0023DA796D|nr:speckle-type POZ protein-like [Oppia nitens]
MADNQRKRRKIYKTKVVFTINDFANVANDRVFSEMFVIGSNGWKIVVNPRVDLNGNYNNNTNRERLEFVKYCLQFNSTIGSKTVRQSSSCDISVDTEIKSYYLVDDCHRIQSIEDKHVFKEYQPKYELKVKRKELIDKIDKLKSLVIVFNITTFTSLSDADNNNNKRFRFDTNFNVCGLNDSTFVVKGKELYASKLILGAKSDVFSLMFSTNMSEKMSNKVIIDDVDSDVFEEFLRYIYSGHSDKLIEMSDQLLYVSNKYLVWDLKNIILNLLFVSITPQTALDVLKTLIDFDASEDLISKVYDFITRNTKAIFEYQFSHNLSQYGFNGKVVDKMFAEKTKKTSTLYYTYSYFE